MDGGEVWIEILEAKWFERYLHTEHFNILKKILHYCNPSPNNEVTFPPEI